MRENREKAPKRNQSVPQKIGGEHMVEQQEEVNEEKWSWDEELAALGENYVEEMWVGYDF